MKSTRTDKSYLFILALLISLSACVGTKNSIQGKWEANIVSKRTGQGVKVTYEFLSDGTFNAMPSGDTTIVDKDKYEVLDEGRTVKIRSQLLGGGVEAVCKFTGIAIQCETEDANTSFRRL